MLVNYGIGLGACASICCLLRMISSVISSPFDLFHCHSFSLGLLKCILCIHYCRKVNEIIYAGIIQEITENGPPIKLPVVIR